MTGTVMVITGLRSWLGTSVNGLVLHSSEGETIQYRSGDWFDVRTGKLTHPPTLTSWWKVATWHLEEDP